ncbi:MAG: hypothetical protein KJ574_00960 [Nanoarchaeota archaeon]|nr:hypothetical protein [Nanoarchaeota archaeon]
MDKCTPQCTAMKLLVFGIVLILVRMYTTWDIWIVIGALLIIKAIMLFIMPICPCIKGKKK